MSVSAAGESPMSRGVVWVAHSLPYVVLGWVAYSVLEWFQVVRLPPLIDLAVAVLPMGVAYLAFSKHQADGSLCLRCIQEVPVDAEQRAQGRYAWVLWVFHYFTASVWRILNFRTRTVAARAAAAGRSGLRRRVQRPVDLRAFGSLDRAGHVVAVEASPLPAVVPVLPSLGRGRG